MATYDELFGNKNSGDRRPKPPKWNAPGDSHVGVITGEPEIIDALSYPDFKKLFMVKTSNPKNKSEWERAKEGEFDTSLEHFAMKEIAVPVTLQDGTPATFYFPQNDEALKDAMQESGVPLIEGTTIGRKFLRKEGSRRKWSVKLVAPASE